MYLANIDTGYISVTITTVAVHNNNYRNYLRTLLYMGTAVAQWLRVCATIRKVAGSISVGVSGFFIVIKSFRSHYDPGVDAACNRNGYQEYFLGVKTAGA